MSLNPVIFYVDDEPFQHIALEQILPENWQLICFDNPVEAISRLKESNPALIISDQRMPQMHGFKFLETARQICPDAIRIITTGYNDENSIIESIRSAKIFDYIVKPWDIEKLLQSTQRAVDYYYSEKERKELSSNLNEKNIMLTNTLKDMEILLDKYKNIQTELRSWVHPFVLKATEDKIVLPCHKPLSLLVIDIIDSSKLHQNNHESYDIRTKVLQAAWEIVLKHGGEIESQEGDKVYANFGLSDDTSNLCNAAYAAAKEFRSSLQAINDHYGVNIEAGIAIHYAESCKVNLRQTAINNQNGIIVRKKFDTSSSDVDLCHRLESLAHSLPGSNIFLSEQIRNGLNVTNANFIEIGNYTLKGQQKETRIFLIKSDKVTEKDLDVFKKSLNDKYKHLKAS